jgi:hypothetical protein
LTADGAQRGRIYSAAFLAMTWNVTRGAVPASISAAILRTLRTAGGEERRPSFAQLGFTGAYHWDGGRSSAPAEGKIEDYRAHVGRFTDCEGRFAHAFSSGGGHVTFDGITFRHSPATRQGLFDSSGNVFQHCRAEYCNAGTFIKGDSSNNTIQDSVS